jgi:BASS family bile acid:Na+ symporter
MESVASGAILLFVVTNMLSVGLGLSLAQILEPFRSIRLVLSSLAANFFLVPALAYIITRTIALDRPMTIAVLLLGTGAGAPFLPKLVEFARGNLGYAVGLMMMLMSATVVYMPMVLPLLLPVTNLGRWPVAKPLVTMMLLPLTVGLFIGARKRTLARHIQPFLRRASTAAFILALTVVLVVNYHAAARTIGFRAILAATLLLLSSFGCGLLLGGPSNDTRTVLAFGTAQRDISAALLVAVENFSDRDIVVMLTLVAFLGVCIQVPIAVLLGRRSTSALQETCEAERHRT